MIKCIKLLNVIYVVGDDKKQGCIHVIKINDI